MSYCLINKSYDEILCASSYTILFEFRCSSENVRFWCAVNDYRANFDEEKCIPTSTEVDDEKSPPSVQANDGNTDTKIVAKGIYKQFISHHSNNQVNLSSKQRNDIKNAIDLEQLKK